MLKASLHIHIQGDPEDYLNYTGFDVLDRAHKLGYEVIAFTCHHRVVMTPEFQEHAKKLDILLITGVELNLGGDIVVLNASPEIERLKTPDDLRQYRLAHPEIFIMAAHPFFPVRKWCLQERIHDCIDIFDAIEHCWFYSKLINLNKKAQALAKKHNLPYIATADLHLLSEIRGNHVLIDAEKNIESVLEALRQGKFKSVAKPQGIFQMFWTFAKMQAIGFSSFLPWAPPHIPFQHEKFHRQHQTKSKSRSQKTSISRRI